MFTSHLQLLSLIPLSLDILPNNLYSHTFILEYKKLAGKLSINLNHSGSNIYGNVPNKIRQDSRYQVQRYF